METDRFITITATSEGVYKEKGSRFLAWAIPIESEQEAKSHVAEFRKKYYDARHHAYAYMIGPGQETYRAFDDGEPKHSAGDPILGQIKSRQLTNLIVIVVRYFGGIQLGLPGLTAAYRLAAADALSKAVRIEKEVMIPATIYFEYNVTSDVMRMIKDALAEVVQESFEEEAAIHVMVPKARWQHFMQSAELQIALGKKIKVTS